MNIYDYIFHAYETNDLLKFENLINIINSPNKNNYFKYIESDDDMLYVTYSIRYHINKMFINVCQNGDNNDIIKFITHRDWKYRIDFNDGLFELCKRGDIEKINLLNNYYKIIFPKNNLNWNRGLFGSCEGGHLKVAKLMIEKGAKELSYGIRYVYNKNDNKNDKKELIDLMIEQGANDWDYILHIACLNKDKKLILLSMKNLPYDYDYNTGLRSACMENNLEIVDLMIEKGANDWNKGLEGACSGGHLEIVKLMIKKGANRYSSGLHYACCSGNLDLAKLMIEYCVKIKDIKSLNYALQTVSGFDHENNIEIVKLLIQHGANNFEQGLCYACNTHNGTNVKILKLMIEHGANANRCCSYKRNRYNIRVVKLLQEGLDINHLQNIKGYDLLVEDLKPYNMVKDRLRYKLFSELKSIVIKYSGVMID